MVVSGRKRDSNPHQQSASSIRHRKPHSRARPSPAASPSHPIILPNCPAIQIYHRRLILRRLPLNIVCASPASLNFRLDRCRQANEPAYRVLSSHWVCKHWRVWRVGSLVNKNLSGYSIWYCSVLRSADWGSRAIMPGLS